jgi:hypothetical protein
LGTTGGDWMRLGAATGMASSAPTTLLVSADRSQLARGLYEGTLRLQSNVYGDICTNDVPIHLRVENNRLMVTSAGVGFSKLPARAVLTRTLRVSDTWHAGTVTWNAIDDAAWLSVTSSGSTAGTDGGALVLTADPTGLAPGQYFAEVAITPAVGGLVENSQAVRVGLAVRAADAPATVDPPATNGAGRLAANPVTPEFYACSNIGFNVEVYDVYTGALLRSFPGGCAFGLVLSDDGRTLFMRDGGNTLTVADVVTGNVQATYNVNAGGLMYLRPDAHPVLLTGNAISVDLEAGVAHNDNNGTFGVYSKSADQRHVYGASQYASGFEVVQRVGVRFSALVDRRIVFDGYLQSTPPAVPGGSAFVDVVVSQVSNKVFGAADGVDRRLAAFDATTLAPLPSIISGQYMSAAETHWSGRLAALGSSGQLPASHDVRIFDDAGNLLTTIHRAGAGAGAGITSRSQALAFSADGTRLLSAGDAQPHVDAVP